MLKENALTTIERAKEFIYGRTTEGELPERPIADAINAASSAIEVYCRRKFKRQHHVQQIRERTNEVFLDEYPVTQLISVGGVPKDNLSQAFFIDSESGIVDFTSGSGVRGIVEYEAGYILPKDATEDELSDLPSDLELACLQLVDRMYVDEDGFSLDVASIKLGDWTVRDGNTSQADIDSIIPNEIRVLLDGHRAWPVVT